MEINPTNVKGLFIIQPKVYYDDRVYFFESYKEYDFKLKITNINFFLDNESYYLIGVFIVLNFQLPPFDQSKLIRVIDGEILDVVVDLRSSGKTFGVHKSFILSSQNKLQLFVPRGFAHGFLVRSKTAVINYKVDNIYNKKSESGIIFNDTSLNINWDFPFEKIIISDKDKKLKSFNELLKDDMLF